MVGALARPSSGRCAATFSAREKGSTERFFQDQSPYRQGRHHELVLIVSGAGSQPWPPQGWQRQRRAVAIQLPAQAPWRRTASAA
jgi:hypothetical protein